MIRKRPFAMISAVIKIMISKKIFLTTIAISLAFHVAILAAASFMEFRNHRIDRSPLIVSLEDPPQKVEADVKKIGLSRKEGITAQKDLSIKSSAAAAPKREDTIELNAEKTKYDIYLAYLREKIEREWRYPASARRISKEGMVVVRFSITDEGGLLAPLVIDSSGHRTLDSEAIRVIRSVAPFEPLPAQFNISQLNVIAAFDYGTAH